MTTPTPPPLGGSGTPGIWAPGTPNQPGQGAPGNLTQTNAAGQAIPAGIGPQPPDTVRVEDPKRVLENVERFLSAVYPGNGRHALVYHREAFYHWIGTHWEDTDPDTLRAAVYRFFGVGVYVGSVGRGQNATPAWVDFDVNKAKVDLIIDGIKSMVLVSAKVNFPSWIDAENRPIPDEEMGRRAVDMIACQNFLVQASPRDYMGHGPVLFNQFAVKYNYMPGAQPPHEWLTFLKSVWPDDQESIDTLQEMFGYLLTNRNDHHKMFMLYGAKRGGKGTILRVVTALLGGDDNVASSSMNALNGQFGLANLVGKTMATMPDLRFRSRDDGTAIENLLKITGDDTVLIDKKFKSAYEVHLTTRFLIASNELPKMQDESGALQSRIILFKFTQSFYGREDRMLEFRLMGELPAILNWSLDGLDRLNARGAFVQPASGQEDLDTITELSSPTLAFIESCCEVDGLAEIPIRDLFEVWRSWCGEINMQPGSAPTFGKNIGAAVPSIKKVKRGGKGAQVTTYVGIGLNDDGRSKLGYAQWGASLGQPQDTGSGGDSAAGGQVIPMPGAKPAENNGSSDGIGDA